jgi:hypothetical protein
MVLSHYHTASPVTLWHTWTTPLVTLLQHHSLFLCHTVTSPTQTVSSPWCTHFFTNFHDLRRHRDRPAPGLGWHTTSHSELSPSSGLLHHHHGIQCYALVALQVQAQLREGIVLRIAVTYYVTPTCHTCYITLLPKGFVPMLFLAYLVQYWAF